MSSYLLICSRDPFEHANVSRFYALAGDLAQRGSKVTVMLVENGALAARRSPASETLSNLAQRDGVTVLADELSLRERGIDHARLAAGIEPAPIDAIVDALEAGAKALWH